VLSLGVEGLVSTGNLFLKPLEQLWRDFIQIFPNIVVAILLLVLGYFVAFIVGHVVKWLLEKVGLNKYIKEAHLTKEMGHTNVPNLTGDLVKWFVFIIFLQVAVEILNLSTLSSLLDEFVRWLPNVLVAIIVFFVGVALAHYVDYKIRSHTNMRGMKVLSGVLKVVILFLAIIVGLGQIGVKVGVLENAFLILVGALGLGFALAMGIGLGLGLKDEAEDIVSKFKKNL